MLLQRIAHRLNNGPNMVQTEPFSATTEFELRMAQSLRAPVELLSKEITELDSVPYAQVELDAGNDAHLYEMPNPMILRNSAVREDIQGGFG